MMIQIRFNIVFSVLFYLSFLLKKNGVLRVDSVNFGEKYFNTTGGGGGGGGVLGSLMPT